MTAPIDRGDEPEPQPNTCPDCGHEQHGASTECEHPVSHGPNRWHRCLCLARPAANHACPPLMTCQGGPYGYADLWYLQQGRSIQGADGKTITPDLLTAEPQPARHTADTINDDDLDQLYVALEEARSWARHGYELGQVNCTWSDYGVAPAWLTEGWPTHFPSPAPAEQPPDALDEPKEPRT